VALSDAQIEALKPLETVFVKRFHREGQVVRVKPGKQVVVVSVGHLEVEVPYSGLARVAPPESAKRPAPTPAASETSVGAAPAASEPTAAPAVQPAGDSRQTAAGEAARADNAVPFATTTGALSAGDAAGGPIDDGGAAGASTEHPEQSPVS